VVPTSTEQDVYNRLVQVKVELQYADTPGFHDRIIINEGFEKAYAELEEFTYQPVSQASGSGHGQPGIS
jgi:guanylate kinase